MQIILCLKREPYVHICHSLFTSDSIHSQERFARWQWHRIKYICRLINIFSFFLLSLFLSPLPASFINVPKLVLAPIITFSSKLCMPHIVLRQEKCQAMCVTRLSHETYRLHWRCQSMVPWSMHDMSFHCTVSDQDDTLEAKHMRFPLHLPWLQIQHVQTHQRFQFVEHLLHIIFIFIFFTPAWSTNFHLFFACTAKVQVNHYTADLLSSSPVVILSWCPTLLISFLIARQKFNWCQTIPQKPQTAIHRQTHEHYRHRISNHCSALEASHRLIWKHLNVSYQLFISFPATAKPNHINTTTRHQVLPNISEDTFRIQLDVSMIFPFSPVFQLKPAHHFYFSSGISPLFLEPFNKIYFE